MCTTRAQSENRLVVDLQTRSPCPKYREDSVLYQSQGHKKRSVVTGTERYIILFRIICTKRNITRPPQFLGGM